MKLLSKMYKPQEINARLEQISVSEKNLSFDDAKSADDEISYSDAFCNPMIRKSGWVGITLAAFQQLTGINAIILYSSTIFANAGEFSANQGSAIVNSANMLASIGGVILLSYVGRKTLMVINQFLIIISLAIMWYASVNQNDTLELAMVVAFVCFFEFGPGPIVWIYISEICNDKATSVGTMNNWVFTLLISLLSPYMLQDWLKSYTFILFAAISTFGLLFMVCVMKETKGLSEQQVKSLYK